MIAWILFAALIVVWLLGLLSGFAGPMINLLLVAAGVIVLVLYLRDTGRV